MVGSLLFRIQCLKRVLLLEIQTMYTSTGRLVLCKVVPTLYVQGRFHTPINYKVEIYYFLELDCCCKGSPGWDS